MEKHFSAKGISISRIALAVVLSFTVQGYGNVVEGQEIAGITGITKGSADLTTLPDPFLGKAGHQTGGWLIQVAPRKAALLSGRFLTGTGSIDFVDGGDLILFDDLDSIGSGEVIPLTRNARLPGDSTIVIRGFPVGGFVPFGAKQEDGSAHPHAGTGFGLSYNSVKEID